MDQKRIYYKNSNVTISYYPKLCIHAAECVKGLPEVFNSNNNPWVNPGGADVNEIAEVISKCPTSALKFERHDGGEPESAPKSLKVVVKTNGPIYLNGNIHVVNWDGETVAEATRIALCRCGASKNKPFCDNSHKEINFYAE